MRKKWMRFISVLLTMTMLLGSAANVSAANAGEPVDATTADNEIGSMDEELIPVTDENTDGEQPPEENRQDTDSGDLNSDEPQDSFDEDTDDSEDEDDTETEQEDLNGTVKVDGGDEDLKGAVTVETDKNDDKVKIKKNDKPYLALGVDLTAEQQATVLSLMGIDAGKLGDYDVVYVNNAEEHQYLDSYIDSSKIGTKSLSSIVIVERGKGNGINISTNNISYCTVGMYKNALATAGITDADIIVAGPFAISGTAALVGIFKAYKEMTGEDIDEENIDAALHELVITGKLESAGGNSDEVENLIAFVKQSVVEHDLSDESQIREVVAEGCDKFGLTLTEDEVVEVVKLMQKISALDLDLDSLLNSAQSIYNKIANADGGFWAKIREILRTLVDKIRELF